MLGKEKWNDTNTELNGNAVELEIDRCIGNVNNSISE